MVSTLVQAMEQLDQTTESLQTKICEGTVDAVRAYVKLSYEDAVAGMIHHNAMMPSLKKLLPPELVQNAVKAPAKESKKGGLSK